MFFPLKEKKYILPMYQNKTQSVENKLFFNDFKRRRMELSLRLKFEDKYAEDKKYCKVRDHRHFTGEYRIAVHI